MIAIIQSTTDCGKIPVTYVRGGKKVVVERAKSIVEKLNKMLKENTLPDKIRQVAGRNFSFTILHSVDELKI